MTNFTHEIIFPHEIMTGSVGDLAQVLSEGNEIPPEFIFMAGLAMVGSLLGTDHWQERQVLAGENCPDWPYPSIVRLPYALDADPRLFLVLHGESADVRKSEAIRKARRFFQEMMPIGYRPNVILGAGSAEGLAKQISDKSTVLVYDELKLLFDKGSIQGPALFGLVAGLYEGGDWENPTKEGMLAVKNARLSVVAACTRETYNAMWHSAAIDIGLPNRLFLVEGTRRNRVYAPPKPDTRKLTSIRDRLIAQLSLPPRILPIDPDANQLAESWYNSLESSVHAKRLEGYSHRFSQILAVTTDRTRIDKELMSLVLRLMDYQLAVRRIHNPIQAESKIARLEQRIRNVLIAKGSRKKRYIRNYVNGNRVGVTMFNQALENLQTDGDIIKDPKTDLFHPSKKLIEQETMPSGIVENPSLASKKAQGKGGVETTNADRR